MTNLINVYKKYISFNPHKLTKIGEAHFIQSVYISPVSFYRDAETKTLEMQLIQSKIEIK